MTPGRMRRFTQNILQWNKKDIKSTRMTNGDYCLNFNQLVCNKFYIRTKVIQVPTHSQPYLCNLIQEQHKGGCRKNIKFDVKIWKLFSLTKHLEHTQCAEATGSLPSMPEVSGHSCSKTQQKVSISGLENTGPAHQIEEYCLRHCCQKDTNLEFFFRHFYLGLYITELGEINRTSSMPNSVLHIDKAQYFSLEFSLQPLLFPNEKTVTRQVQHDVHLM